MAKTATRDETREELLALRFKYADLERQLATAQATIEALQWTPITPENLPKVGDEVWGPYTTWAGNPACYLQVVSRYHCIDLLPQSGYTHRRPISPPAQDSATEAERAAEQRAAEGAR
jgi:hypothetical protein